MGERTEQQKEWAREYNRRMYGRDGYRAPPEQRIEPPANVERRAFSAPCFLCNAAGECRHRRVA